MIDPHDEQRWNMIHENTHEEEGAHNTYAQEREKEFPRESLICEMGGGTGEDAVYFLKQGHKVYLFDISEFALQRAKEKADKAGVSKSLVTRQIDFGYQDLPLPDASMNVVYSRISLNYFPAERTIEIFKDVYRVLKQGGKAYLTFKSPEDEKEMKRLKDKASLYEEQVYIDNGQLRSRFTQQRLIQLLNAAGIPNAKVEPHQERREGEDLRTLYVNEVVFEK